MIINEEQLTKISLAAVIVGLAALYVVSTNLQPVKSAISEINASSIGKYVNVTGTVSGFKKTQNGIFFDLGEDNATIKVVMWENIEDQLKFRGFDMIKIKDGTKINLAGVVQPYKGSLEIIPTKGELDVIE